MMVNNKPKIRITPLHFIFLIFIIFGVFFGFFYYKNYKIKRDEEIARKVEEIKSSFKKEEPIKRTKPPIAFDKSTPSFVIKPKIIKPTENKFYSSNSYRDLMERICDLEWDLEELGGWSYGYCWGDVPYQELESIISDYEYEIYELNPYYNY